jgi:acyl-coenzyme A synthetase/AMP-(fatty) acid ligase
MFRTGDRVVARGDGTFELLGRADGVVKVGGKRVVLAWVRDRVLTVAGVREAVVLAFQTPNGRGVEIAALVEGRILETDLSRALKAVLEPWESPRILRVVDRVPRTSAGKVDLVKARALLEKTRTQVRKYDE